MALGDPVRVHVDPNPGQVTRPAQIPSPWVTVIDVGGMDAVDNLPITNPATHITATTHHIGKVGKRGTTLRLRMRYDDADATLTTDAVIAVFGRYNSTDAWMQLLTKAGNRTTTMTTDYTNDVEDGTDGYTQVHPENHAFDLEGCDEFLVGVEVVYAVSGGDATLASLQAKII